MCLVENQELANSPRVGLGIIISMGRQDDKLCKGILNFLTRNLTQAKHSGAGYKAMERLHPEFLPEEV
jgi:hypothetical protein